MDPPSVDPSGIAVPTYDEDPEEAFIGPQGLSNFFQEESDVAELFTGEYEDDDDEYFDGAGFEPSPLEGSAPQRTAQSEAGQPETVSGHTHLLLLKAKGSNRSLCNTTGHSLRHDWG